MDGELNVVGQNARDAVTAGHDDGHDGHVDVHSCERVLRRAGRRLQAIGQLLEQNPRRLMVAGGDHDQRVTGRRPVVIDLEELRTLFDANDPSGIRHLLVRYHALLARSEERME